MDSIAALGPDQPVYGLQAQGVSQEQGLSTRVENGSLIVEVGDTGPGMPAEVRARAFDEEMQSRLLQHSHCLE